MNKCLKPLCSENNYIINNTQEFPMSLEQHNPLLHNKEYVLYDVQSLSTKVPVNETMNYILQ